MPAFDRLARWAQAPAAFPAFALGLAAYVAAGLALLWEGGTADYWEHLAAMAALARDPLRPDHPYLATGEPTHLFTPYHLAWALMARGAGVHPIALLPLAGLVNVGVFAAAVHALDRRLGGRGRYRLVLALTFLFGWVWPWRHSGVYAFGMLPSAAAYPFWLAGPAAVLLFLAAERQPGLARWAVLAVGAALVFVVHPVTGAFLFTALLLRAGLGLRAGERGMASLLAFVSVAVGLALLWPYFPIGEALLRSGSFEAIGFGGTRGLFYTWAPVRLAPALLGLAYVVPALRRRRLDLVTTGVVVSAAIYLGNALTVQSPSVARFVVLLAFFLHLAVVLALRRRLPLGPYVALLLVLAVPEVGATLRRIGPVVDAATGTVLGTHTHGALGRQLRALLPEAGPEEVVLAPIRESWVLPPLVGVKVAAAWHGDPFMEDYLARWHDVERFYGWTGQPAAEKRAMPDRFGARYVLVPRAALAVVQAALTEWEVTAEDEAYVVFERP